jgi:hypothetical protein
MYCQPAAGGCVEVAELHPLGVLPPDYQTEWWGFDDSLGQHAIFSRFSLLDEAPGGAFYTWSAEAGVVELSPIQRSDGYFGLYAFAVDASAALGSIDLRRFYWSRAGGIQFIDIQNPSMSRGGGVVAGERNRHAVRWTPAGGAVELAELDSDRFRSYAAEDAVMFVDLGTILHFDSQDRRTTIALPSDAPPGAGFGNLAANLTGSQFAVTVNDGNVEVPYLWTGSELRRLDPAGSIPGGGQTDRGFRELTVSNDGTVVVAEVGPSSFTSRQLIRWSEQTGIQVLHDDPASSLRYVSPGGDTLVVTTERETPDSGERRVVFRWSAAEGMVEVPVSTNAWYVANEGNLFVELKDQRLVVHKYGPALSETLPIERFHDAILPGGWLPASLLAVSPEGRLVTGRAVDDSGAVQDWLLRLRSVCTERP